jgi:hypothetical protein
MLSVCAAKKTHACVHIHAHIPTHKDKREFVRVDGSVYICPTYQNTYT